jgi:predicted ThiF/HesA family dinucleotide-utilizing enzyme
VINRVSKNDNLYESVVKVSHGYLGPAAERFIDRQVRNHLHKEPEQITKKDLSKLVDWVRVAVSLLTDDTVLVKEYISQLEDLAGGRKQ